MGELNLINGCVENDFRYTPEQFRYWMLKMGIDENGASSLLSRSVEEIRNLMYGRVKISKELTEKLIHSLNSRK